MKVLSLGTPKGVHVDLVLRLGSLWIGAHYSPKQRAWCVTLIPCITVRIGRTPYKPDKKAAS